MSESASLIVVFHKDGPRISSQAIDERGCGDGASKVRNDSNEMRFTQGSNLHHLRYAAYVGQGSPDKVDIMMFDERVEVPSIAPLLTRSQRHVDLAAQNRQVL